LNFLKEIDAKVPDGPPAALSCSLHADLGVMDQSGRALVRRAHQKTAPTRCPHLGQELEADIRSFIDRHNQNPRPFKWTKSADQILASVKRFCHKVQQTLCSEL
jgi:hypothetical protein